MITKKTIQQYAFNKPDIRCIIYTIPLLLGIFVLMLASTTFLENELLLLGFIGSGIMVGLSLTLTKNIFFPIGIILIYNLTVTIQQSLIEHISSITLFETIFRSIGDALFIVFVIYYIVTLSQYILAKIKRLQNPKDEPVTTNKFILGSIVSGFLYGIFMVISTV